MDVIQAPKPPDALLWRSSPVICSLGQTIRFAGLFFTPMALLMATGVIAATSDVSQLLVARGLDTMIGRGVGLAVLLARSSIDPDQALRRLANKTAALRPMMRSHHEPDCNFKVSGKKY